MALRQSHRPATSAARSPAGVIVGVIAGPEGPAGAIAQALPHWRRLTPLAVWSTVNLQRPGPTEIMRGVDAMLARHGIRARQLILLGEGRAGRLALELVLQGALSCAGMLAIAIPCAALPFPIVPTAAAIRLVVSPQDLGHTPNDLVSALRTADIDERIIRLSPASADDSRVAASAAETFVLELVATVGHQARHGVRTDEIQKG
jgi:hypothetical protein